MFVRRLAVLMVCALAACVLLAAAPTDSAWASAGWGWKLATTPDDALNFLNGTGAYTKPVGEARIEAIWKQSHAEYYVFYRPSPGPARSWGWKLATDPDDVLRFLSGAGPYAHPVRDAQIAAIRKGTHLEFTVFYQNPEPGEQPSGGWGWKRATAVDDALNFLNGTGAYQHPVTTARIAAVPSHGTTEFYIFYRGQYVGGPVPAWRWKLATTITDALHYVNGTAPYKAAVGGFQYGAVWLGSHTRYYVFANDGTKVWMQSPLVKERFVQGEPVPLAAMVTGDYPVEYSNLTWTSSLAGTLGTGAASTGVTLPPGNQVITAALGSAQAARPVRVFTDLDQLYQSKPADGEVARLNDDFIFVWANGTGTDEQWSTYPVAFDQQSTDPSKLVIYAKLDVLRHQRFSEPPPFTAGATAYDHLKAFVHTIELRLDCGYSSANGAGVISLNRGLSVWDARTFAPGDPDACKAPLANPSLYPYVNPLYLILHEGRHDQPSDPGHISVNGQQMDPYLENGSGHAWAALYTMWVYKYSLYDPQPIRDEAKSIATGLLQGRFPSRPTHSNPKVQAVIDELLPAP